MGDVWPRLRSNGWTRALCCGLIALVGGVFSFFNTAPPGYTAGQLMMGYAQFAVIAICLAQLLAVSYMYGFQRFIRLVKLVKAGKLICFSNVRTMLGETNRCQWLGAYWWISWIAIGPAILAATLIIRMAMHRPSKTFMYAWPIGLDVYGWMMFLAIVVLMPAMLIYQIIRARVRHEPIVALFEPLPHFGPAIFKDRDKCLRDERARRVL